MTTQSTLAIINSFHSDLKIVKESVYDKCGFNLTNPRLNAESAAYGACSFELDGKAIQHRIAKITPAKTGQFVTIWKRNNSGITEPFDVSDNLDFIIITVRSGDNAGQFIFPAAILAVKGIITKEGKEGKRGIRVYPPWDTATNKQAVITQSWQTKYFLSIEKGNSTDLDLAKKLLAKTN
jgi:hypothetical protein